MPRAATQPGVGGYATSYTFDGEAVGHFELGTLLVVAEVDTSAKAGEAVVDLIIHTVGDQYYNQNTDLAPTDRFETAIKTLNGELSDYSKQDSSWVGKIHAVIAVLASDGMHITNAGGSEALLVRRDKSVPIKADSQSGDDKYFPSVASGQLKAGDKILLTTKALLHLVDESKLPELVGRTNPNRGVQELASMIGAEPGNQRSAAIIAEVITPESLSMMPRPTEPATSTAGPIPTWLHKLQAFTTPAASKLASGVKNSSVKAVGVTKTHVLPQLKTGSLKVAGAMRNTARNHRQSPKLWAGLAVAAAVVIVFLLQASAGKALSKQVEQFTQAVATYNSAQAAYADGNKDDAKTKLALAGTQLDGLSKSKNAAQLDKALRAKSHTEGEPGNLDELRASINGLSDSLESLVRLTPTTVVDFATTSGAKPAHLEQVGASLIAVDNNGVYFVGTGGGQVKTAKASFGTVVATTSGTDSVFVLTSEPAVWQFKPADDSLTKLTLTIGDWPKSKAIAQYIGNLYLLSDDQVNKFVPTIGGFSAQNPYLVGDAAADAKAATSIAVDGSVYLGGGPKGLARYFAGNFAQAATGLPGTLATPTVMRGNGSNLLLVATSQKRFGLLTTGEEALTFIRQFEFKDTSDLADTIYDANTKTIYAVAGNKLVKSQISF